MWAGPACRRWFLSAGIFIMVSSVNLCPFFWARFTVCIGRVSVLMCGSSWDLFGLSPLDDALEKRLRFGFRTFLRFYGSKVIGFFASDSLSEIILPLHQAGPLRCSWSSECGCRHPGSETSVTGSSDWSDPLQARLEPIRSDLLFRVDGYLRNHLQWLGDRPLNRGCSP